MCDVFNGVVLCGVWCFGCRAFFSTTLTLNYCAVCAVMIFFFTRIKKKKLFPFELRLFSEQWSIRFDVTNAVYSCTIRSKLSINTWFTWFTWNYLRIGFFNKIWEQIAFDRTRCQMSHDRKKHGDAQRTNCVCFHQLRFIYDIVNSLKFDTF